MVVFVFKDVGWLDFGVGGQRVLARIWVQGSGSGSGNMMGF